jgi:uncharacterized membrane protein
MTDSRADSPGGQPPGEPEDRRIEELKLRLDGLQARLDAHLAEGADRAATPAATAPSSPAAPSQWVLPGAWSAPPAVARPPAPATPGVPVAAWSQASPASPAAATVPPAPAPAGSTPTSPTESFFSRASLADLEERLTGRILAWVGGIALIAGAILFLSLAFSRGWIGPEARVILGLAGGGLALGLGAWLFEESRQRAVAHVLTAVGLGTISVTLIAATRLYGLIPAEVGLAGSLLTAVVAAFVAVRAGSQTVAGFGLVAVLAAPPLMGASPNLVTMGFLATALVGTTAIALFRSWAYLPWIAFFLSAPQLASWLVGLDSDVRLLGLTVLAVYWMVNTVAAAGEEILRRRRVLRPATATLVLANAAFLVSAGFVLLDGSLETYRGAFLAGVALAHFAVGGWFLRAEGDRHLFGLLVTGTGLAALTIAVPVQFGASVVPIAWAAEAVVLAWIRVRRDHVYSGAAAALLGVFAIDHILLVEMPLRDLSGLVRPDVPFADPSGLAAAFVVAAVVLAAWILRVAWERAAAISVAVLLAVYTLPFELVGVVVLVGWAILAVGAIAIDRLLLTRADRPSSGSSDRAEALAWLERSVCCAGAVAYAAALGHALVEELPLRGLLRTELPAVPFLDPGGLAIVILVAGALAVAFIDRRPAVRVGCGLLAGGIVAYGVTFELPLDAVVVAWSSLAVVYAAVATARREEEAWWLGAADGLAALGAAAILAALAPVDRLVVDSDRTGAVLPFLNGTTAAIAAVLAALTVSVRLHARQRTTPIRVAVAAIAAVYLLSVGVVDLFQVRLGGSIGEDELAKQAQVALSVLWAILGAGAFTVGLVAHLPRARQAGLALLGLVTAKVFLVDLSALDVAYRVLSLLALGIVLLGSAYLFGRFRPVRPIV